MAGEIEAAVDACRTILSDIAGLEYTPNDPPERVNAAPVLVVSVGGVEWIAEASGQVRGLHTIRIGIYKPRKNLELDHQEMLPYGDLVKDKLLADDNKTLSGTISGPTNSPITGEFGAIDYAGQELIGWTINYPVKIRSGWDGSAYAKG